MDWIPFLVAIPVSCTLYSTYHRDFPTSRILGSCFMLLWFGMSLWDFMSGHKLLDWMYGRERDE